MTSRRAIDVDQALRDPAGSFASPDAVLVHDRLTTAQKIAILRRWRQDAGELPPPEEEGTSGAEPSLADRIAAALDHLESLSGDEPPGR